MKKVLISISLTVGILFLGGCTQSIKNAASSVNSFMGIPNTPQEFIAQQSNKEMASALSEYFDKDGYHMGSYGNKGFYIKENLASFDKNNVTLNRARGYVAGLNIDNSKMADKYKDVLGKRSNTYSVYKNIVNQKIFEALVGGELSGGDDLKYFYFNWTPAIVEYDSNGRMVSAFIHKVIVKPNPFAPASGTMPVALDIETIILNKSAINLIENSINNTFLAQNVLYSSKKAKDETEQVIDTSSKSNKIKELYQLYKDGALSKSEYAQEKDKILNATKIVKTKKLSQTPQIGDASFNSYIQSQIVKKYNDEHGTSYKTIKEVTQDFRSK